MSVEAEAFKALYPEQYFARFFERDTRPDGRSLRRSRPTVIGFKAVSSADSSALVKIGSTTALCTLNLHVSNPAPCAAQRQPPLEVLVEITPLCQRTPSSGRLPDWSKTVARQVERILRKSQLLPDEHLRIPDSLATWRAALHVTVLDADGCVFDAAFLACVSALQAARVPHVEVDTLQRAKRKTEGRDGLSRSRLPLRHRPVSLTLGCLGAALVADPTGEEEAVMAGSVTAVVNEEGDLLGECWTFFFLLFGVFWQAGGVQR